MIVAPNFTPFFGRVEDINDPLENGRLRVRVFGYNTDNKGILPTESLHWFSSGVSNSAAIDGLGDSPTGVKLGSMVFGYYIDEYKQSGIVICAFNGMPGGVNDVSPIATGKSNKHIDDVKAATKKDISSASGSTFSEPETKYAAKYPNNFTKTTKSGHVIEIDDTEGAERIKLYHKSGTMIEMHPDGQIVYRNKTETKIINGDKNTFVSGDVNNTVEQSLYNKIANDIKQIIGNQFYSKSADVHLDAPKIVLGELTSVEPSVLGDKLASWINGELVPWLNSHKHTSASPGSPTSPPISPFQAGTAKSGGAVYSKKNSNQ